MLFEGLNTSTDPASTGERRGPSTLRGLYLVTIMINKNVKWFRPLMICIKKENWDEEYYSEYDKK